MPDLPFSTETTITSTVRATGVSLRELRQVLDKAARVMDPDKATVRVRTDTADRPGETSVTRITITGPLSTHAGGTLRDARDREEAPGV